MRRRSSPAAGAVVLTVAAGYEHTCALLAGGTVECWGFNSNGQLGTGDATDRYSPTAIAVLGSGVRAPVGGGCVLCLLSAGDALESLQGGDKASYPSRLQCKYAC